MSKNFGIITFTFCLIMTFSAKVMAQSDSEPSGDSPVFSSSSVPQLPSSPPPTLDPMDSSDTDDD